MRYNPRTEEELDELLSRPSPALVQAIGSFGHRLVILGAGGKMGPVLARMAVRAAAEAGRTDLEVVAVSRFSDRAVRQRLASWGVRTVTADLLDPEQRAALPPASEVLLMVGYKFAAPGTHPSALWGRNAYLHAALAEQYRDARIVCFSTGNVYPLVPVNCAGASEHTPCAPLGPYAEAARSRELLVQFVCELHQTPAVFLRLNYAVDLRYGVPVDIARFLLAGQPVPLQMGYVNIVWERYANEVALRAFGLAICPPTVLNVTGPETLAVREIAEQLAERLGVTPRFEGEPGPTAYLSDARRCHKLFGLPEVRAFELIDMVADWIRAGGVVWDKPTKFWVTTGHY